MSEKGNILIEISTDLIRQFKEKKIPQTEIVRITGKSKGTISKIFNGKHYFSMEDIKSISCELNIPVISIFYSRIYDQVATGDKKLLNTLKTAEERLVENLKGLKELKKSRKKKAAS